MAIPAGLSSYAWVALCAVAAPAVFGLGIVRSLGLHPSQGRRVSWAFAYLTGHYVLAHVTLLWTLTGQFVPGALLPLAAASTGLWLLRRARRQRAAPERAPHASPWTWLPALLLIAALLLDCLQVNLDPIRLSDEAQIWAAKAKVLYAAPRFDARFGLHALVEHADYPLLNPLVQVLSFAGAGRILHWENRLPIQCFGVALLALLSAATTRRAHPLVAALALVAFAGTLFASGSLTVYADVMLSFATLAAVEALLRLRETGDRVWWRLACVAFAAMLASKNEGALLVLAVAVPFLLAWLVERRRRPDAARLPLGELPWLLAPAAAIGLQAAFNHHFDLHNDLLDPALGGGRGLFARVLHNGADYAPQVAAFYGRMLVDGSLHRLLPLLFLAAGVVHVAMDRSRWLAPASTLWQVVVLALLGYMLVFVGTNADLQWHLSTAAARTLQQIVPVAALGLCMVAWPRAAGAVAPPAPAGGTA